MSITIAVFGGFLLKLFSMSMSMYVCMRNLYIFSSLPIAENNDTIVPEKISVFFWIPSVMRRWGWQTFIYSLQDSRQPKLRALLHCSVFCVQSVSAVESPILYHLFISKLLVIFRVRSDLNSEVLIWKYAERNE